MGGNETGSDSNKLLISAQHLWNFNEQKRRLVAVKALWLGKAQEEHSVILNMLENEESMIIGWHGSDIKRSYFQLLPYSQGVATARSSTFFIWQGFYSRCLSDETQRASDFILLNFYCPLRKISFGKEKKVGATPTVAPFEADSNMKN